MQNDLTHVRTNGDPIYFTVRPLPGNAGLEGAFRVHLASRDLDSLHLRQGDLCHLTTLEGTVATGIAWRSPDQVTKTQMHPVKVTDTLRSAFGLTLGNQLTIAKASTQIVHADRITVVDVSDPDSIDASKDDENWKMRGIGLLANVEVITTGVAFETSSRKGLRRRFLIEHIDSRASGSNTLYSVNDKTEVVIQTETAAPPPATPAQRSFVLDTQGIGGLQAQIEALNERLAILIGKINGRRVPKAFLKQQHGGVLLHGPEGTGKTLLLNRLAGAPWRKVCRLDISALAGTIARKSDLIRSTFADALSHQPSLVTIDEIDIIAAASDREASGNSLADVLVSEMKKIRGSQVLVAAAARDVGNVDGKLRDGECFHCELEVPVPDVKARIEILKLLHECQNSAPHELAQTVGERTHGYVGRDLTRLYSSAEDHAIRRWRSAIEGSDDDSFVTLVNELDVSSPTSPQMTHDDDTTELALTLQDYEQALLTIRPTAMRELFFEMPNVSWSDIGGAEAVRQKLSQTIEWPLKQAENMRELRMTPETGVLLYGPPGCSKTLTAKAVATSFGLNFIAIKGAEQISMYVGESERAIRDLFRKARAAAPSIIFIDEIDSIGSSRENGGTKGLNVVTTLLNEMDGIESLNGVLVLAATNKPETLDPALLRPGRFGKHIYIGLPNQSARRQILDIRTRDVRLSEDVDLDEIAARTDGFSGAEVVNVCQEAAASALQRHVGEGQEAKPRVAQKDYLVAIKATGERVAPASTEQDEHWKESGLLH